MRNSHISLLVAGLAATILGGGCSGDSTAPGASALSQDGPTSPQGPKATPPNVAPIGKAGANLLAECASHDGATVKLDASGSSDSDGQIVAFEWFENGKLVATGVTPTATFALGSHTLLLRVTDNQGGTNDAVVSVTVQDTQAPTIYMTVAPSALWPPNHVLRLVSSGIAVSDVCDAAPTLDVSVASNEAENGLGDGDTAPDWLVQRQADGRIEVSVRAERSGLGDGRVYTIGARALDHSGNAASQGAAVSVPHNQ